ncbi:hypothetical protein VTN00DRAFT_580 [Thermoascus crustaceus]|uniref:uncharacterized protein n=1 Tax=Thermoascus crustaceus TaxID=5088 RepID=UPI0037426F57
MCLYRGTRCLHCGHPDFELHQFCQTLLRELQRIDDPYQRDMFLLPFNPPDCKPRLGVNIVGWLVSHRKIRLCSVHSRDPLNQRNKITNAK